MEKLPFTVYDILNYLGAGFVLIASLDRALNAGWLATKEIPAGQIVLWLTIAYITGHIIANFSAFFWERIAVRRFLGAPEFTLFEQKRSWLRFVFQGYFDQLPPETRNRVFKAAAGSGITSAGRALFFHCYAIVKQNPVVYGRLTVFLNLYGFCRNVGTACVIAAGILWFGATFGEWRGRPAQIIKLWWAAGALFAGIMMFYRYLKFYRHFNWEVFTSFAEKAAMAVPEGQK